VEAFPKPPFLGKSPGFVVPCKKSRLMGVFGAKAAWSLQGINIRFMNIYRFMREARQIPSA
jgi:hypothetical protein